MTTENGVEHRRYLKYTEAGTLRETIGSALDLIGKDWSDVRGMLLSVDGIGEIAADKIEETLDRSPVELQDEHYGASEGDDGDSDDERIRPETFGSGYHDKGLNFAATLWLDDAVVMFSDRYSAKDGFHTACDVIPTAPGPNHAFEMAASGPRP